MADAILDEQLRQSRSESKNLNTFNAGAASLNSSVGGKGSTNDFNVFRYPLDLSSNLHPHYVMFFITVRESDLSSAERQSAINTQFNFDDSAQNRQGSDSTTRAGLSVAGGLQTAVSGAQLGSEIGSSFGAATKLVSQVSAAGVGAKVGDKLYAKQAEQRDKVLLKDAIALYLSNKPSVSYKANWQDEELGVIGGMGKMLQGTSLSDIGTKIMGGVGGASANLLMKRNSAGTPFGNVQGAFESSAGVVPNPFSAQLFKSMGFRTFSFDYVFLPKSKDEFDAVKEIIRRFKYFMHPVLGSEKFIMQYPAEFNIAYYHKAKLNEELFRISNCALTDLQVEYGGTDFTVFKGSSKPTEVAMKLTFTELEMLTRERIGVGF